MNESIVRLTQTRDLPDGELLALISGPEWEADLAQAADAQRRKWYGTDVYVRGLIEFTNYCKNDCYYCGIRKSNGKADRYRLTEEQILGCCRQGWTLGFRTFVLQGGEDPWYTDERICRIVRAIKGEFPACAVTLSIGEKERESYAAYRAAGADRYLLRHETASDDHYQMLHPASLSLKHRKNCLFTLKELGYQVGSGFMVGSPGQRPEHLLADLRFLQRLQPAMIGIGPYITHPDTPFHDRPSGDLHLTLRMVSILRLMFPYALLPATTALGTIHPRGRELGLQAGANVVMPNLSPVGVREKYSLYENKICTGEEAAECRSCLESRVRLAGYEIVTARGDVKEDIHD
ncbi:MAG: [FeFe] hydrogenase H-cluster radical SAM maturase HydE [Clostridiales bacterium]|nr:[FeFe] hydrogenase H-cluster radical SAM maturase HydE [Clostridiales bacterium]